jgi:hypothetical protein
MISSWYGRSTLQQNHTREDGEGPLLSYSWFYRLQVDVFEFVENQTIIIYQVQSYQITR